MTTRRCANVLVGLKVPSLGSGPGLAGALYATTYAMHPDTWPKGPFHGLASEVSRGGHPKCTDQGIPELSQCRPWHIYLKA